MCKVGIKLVMAQEWRSRMENECMKWVDGWKVITMKCLKNEVT